MFDTIHKLLEEPTFKSAVVITTRHYKANEKILEQGAAHRGVYLIKKGKVRVIVKAEAKEGVSTPLVKPGIADLGPKDIFGEFGLFDNLPASADVVAVDDSELIEIDIISFRAYLENDPAAGYRILMEFLSSLVARLRHADKTILNLYAWGMKANQLDKYLE